MDCASPKNNTEQSKYSWILLSSAFQDKDSALLLLSAAIPGEATDRMHTASRQVVVSVESAALVTHVAPAHIVLLTPLLDTYPLGHVTDDVPPPAPSASPHVARA